MSCRFFHLLATRLISGRFFVVCCVLATCGCATKSVWHPDESEAARQSRLTRGCIFYFDGAGGGTARENYAGGVMRGLRDAGYPGEAEMMAWETGHGLFADEVASVSYKRAKAVRDAKRILAYRRAHPEAPASLLGFSAGTAEAVFALECLDELESVNHVVLLGAAISRDYDMTEALKRVRGRLYIITSTHDRMLGIAMPFAGTADRKFHDPGAGLRGFVLPRGASSATRKLYAEKIVTIPYEKEFRKDKDRGLHFDNVKEGFIRDFVAPLLMGSAGESRE
jgi:pimeloyl-ACP methyl ester carboxylesterase